MPAFNSVNPRFPETNGFHLFRWENTEYKFNKIIVAPKRTLPRCFNHDNSLIVDRKGSFISDEQIIEVLGKDIVSVNFRPDLYYTQLFFESPSVAYRILEEGPYEINNEILQLHAPSHIPLRHMIIHLANVPGGTFDQISAALTEALSPAFTVEELAPHVIKGTRIMTSRWSAIVSPSDDNPDFKKNPQIIEAMDQKVLIAWAGSKYPCTTCFTIDHSYAQCPDNPKNKNNAKFAAKSFAEAVSASSSSKKPEPQSDSSKIPLSASIHAPPQSTSSPPDLSTMIPIHDPKSPFTVAEENSTSDSSTSSSAALLPSDMDTEPITTLSNLPPSDSSAPPPHNSDNRRSTTPTKLTNPKRAATSPASHPPGKGIHPRFTRSQANADKSDTAPYSKPLTPKEIFHNPRQS